MTSLFFKALADETRLLSLLLILSQTELCVCELMAALDESQPKISRHLAQLRKAGLLSDRRQGQWVFYRLNPELPDWALAVLQQTLAGNPAFIEPPVARLQVMGQRPERSKACCQ
ncbi:metalloregulator ArsR/SmtB family transcription factor [Shewanella sp. AS1]|uniref:metalloregulator ArsR/SmtB family transcription factor n=1 Tax=Shewanella sp. AS1 TaxID=2907626 RepID=UPI001F2C0F47|nr:metalloregulator ArsR/SmtB family transcription factor [Shewanella sp. AS1]MCE9679811.1 metalloregulator ArsR/SmtB family transcription factor [Shewanella sp. AS1]